VVSSEIHEEFRLAILNFLWAHRLHQILIKVVHCPHIGVELLVVPFAVVSTFPAQYFSFRVVQLFFENVAFSL
jgi:hypothetical protein